MNIELLFPFYRDAKVIRSYRVENFDLYDSRYIFEPLTNTYMVDTVNEQFKDNNTIVKIFRIMPNDVYFYDGHDPMKKIYFSSESRPKTINVQVTELDYGRLVREEISLETVDGQLQAVRKLLSGYDMVPVFDTSYITNASSNSSTSVEELAEGVKILCEDSGKARTKARLLSENLKEEFDDVVTQPISSDDLMYFTFKSEPYKMALEHYFANKTATEKIPLLVGISGIAKSATIKELTDKFGYRMIDLRASFLSRLDVDGLKNIQSTGEGGNVSEPAPTEEFLTATDEYLAFSRGMVIKIKNKLTELESQLAEYDPDASLGYLEGIYSPEEEMKKKITALKPILAKFEEASKTPVLFLDELSRSDKAIRGALTTIINQRLYGTRNLKECRIVAATNAPIGYKETDPGGGNIMRQNYFTSHFLTDTLEDKAILDRFDKYLLTPEMVYPDWIKWAKAPKKSKDPDTGEVIKGGDLHKYVLEFIENNGGQPIAFDLTPIDRGYPQEEVDRGTELPIVHATFRAWTVISDYLKKREIKTNYYEAVYETSEYESKDPDAMHMTITPMIITGLVGEELGNKFVAFMKTKKEWSIYKLPKGVDVLDVLIEECLDNGLPLSIVGGSGIGKTARVMRFARKKRNWKTELIPLSTKSRLDIMGYPSLVGVAEHIVGDADPDGLLKEDVAFMREITELQKDSGIPEKITQRAPDGDLVRRIKECISTRPQQPLVLFFDEFNRSIDPVTQTAIFQAISDGTFAGVSFPKGLIKVVLAGNPPDNVTGEAGAIETALVSRTIHFRQLGYTKKDATDFLMFAERSAWEELDKFDKSLPKWVKPEFGETGYEQGAKVNHENTSWVSLEFENVSTPGDTSSGISKVLLDYLKEGSNVEQRVLDIIQSVEKAAIDQNTTSTRSLSMLSDLLDNFNRDRTLSGTLLLPHKTDREGWSTEAGDDDDVFEELLGKINKRIKNWSALGSGKKYPLRGGGTRDLQEMVDKWQEEYKIFVSNTIPTYRGTGKHRIDLFMVTDNLLKIDGEIREARQGLLNTKVDEEFAGQFLEYYNTISGISTMVTIDDIVNEDVIEEYIDQVFANSGGETKYIKENGSWVPIVVDAYNHHGDKVSINYIKMIEVFSKRLSNDEFMSGLEKLITDSVGELVIKSIEFGLRKKLKEADYDEKVLSNHEIYFLVRKLKFDKIIIKQFLEDAKKADPDYSGVVAVDKDKGLHGISSQ